MTDLVKYILFWCIFAGSFVVTFRILQALEIEKYFKKYRKMEIHSAYFIITVLVSYALGKFLLDIIELFPGN
ncbi:DUF1146 family protein [Acholeplasma hippikon]|uniref:DUF1146 domain-containing protein n=1 Tax=Acholeplasma hippikon TaxID=264636 RepID=A0A449BKB1_9MOLU|nr:DUF1146 family protein [Acholeplasma hippikon]VEU82889.1 Uncharacterised protein [Acholeplasma hippikon]